MAGARARVEDDGSGGGSFALFVGVLGPPAIWAIRFGSVYVLVPYVCANDWLWMLHAITALTMIVVAAIGAMSLRRWRGADRRDASAEVHARRRFMALAGVLSAGFFLVVIIAEALGSFFIHPCQQAGFPIA